MFEFVAYTIAWAGLCFGVAGGLYLIFAHLDARHQSFDDATDWERLIDSSFHHDRENNRG